MKSPTVTTTTLSSRKRSRPLNTAPTPVSRQLPDGPPGLEPFASFVSGAALSAGCCTVMSYRRPSPPPRSTALDVLLGCRASDVPVLTREIGLDRVLGGELQAGVG